MKAADSEANRTTENSSPAAGADWIVLELGMEFVWIAPLSMWVGRYTVTNGEFRAKVPSHNSGIFDHHSLNEDRQPVVMVNFDEALAYAEWLTERERAAGRLPHTMTYRLPTEVEWQAFAQCGDGREFPWGKDWPPKYGNYADATFNRGMDLGLGINDYDDGFIVTCPVEDSGMNDWGLYGIGGNVWECCPKDLSGAFGAWRGASWGLRYRGTLRCSYRHEGNPSERFNNCGFRLILV